jgi:tRNA threonylcarbamoyladenosine biosynthesis protein TsaE
MASRTFVFDSPLAMQAWGRRFAAKLKSDDVVALMGKLGSGKTTLVQSIAAAWGYERGAISPTFALVNEYQTRRGTIFHMDMYRLSARELLTFPLEDYQGRGLCLIEWADRVRSRLPADALELRMAIAGPERRTLTLHHPKRRRAA